MSLYHQLLAWRDEQARREGVESFKVFSKATLEAIAALKPQNKEELLTIKGIKEKKFQRYGKSLLSILTSSQEECGNEKLLEMTHGETIIENEPLSVSQFLDGLNMELSGMAARIKGEVTSVDERERVVYFTLKDATDGSSLACLIFRYAYQISGVELSIGQEVIVEGVPEIYKPNGRMSLKIGVIELAGEGALKKAYDDLYQKLLSRGQLSLENKKSLPDFPERIALVTSLQGAAIDDFRMNLAKFGLKVTLYPCSVEGKRAITEILTALKYFREQKNKFDVLVIIRGGGSLESLQAFNSEALINEISEFPLPTLLGVGHEKDITLSALVADAMVSTPTAAAQFISGTWVEVRQRIRYQEQLLFSNFGDHLKERGHSIEILQMDLIEAFRSIQRRAFFLEQEFLQRVSFFSFYLKQKKENLAESAKDMGEKFILGMINFKRNLLYSEEKLEVYNPKRALKLGYAIIQKDKILLKNTKDISAGDIIRVQLKKGEFDAEVKNIYL